MASPSKKSFLHTSHAMSSKSAESLWNGCPLGQCIGGGSPTTALAVGASPNSGGRRKVRPLCVWRGCCATFSRLRAERSAPAESGSMGARGAAAASSLDRRPPLRARRCPDGESASASSLSLRRSPIGSPSAGCALAGCLPFRRPSAAAAGAAGAADPRALWPRPPLRRPPPPRPPRCESAAAASRAVGHSAAASLKLGC